MADDDKTGTPGDLIIATSEKRILVRIQPDGTITYGPEYTPDEAAKVLWEAIARQRRQDEELRLYHAHVDVLIRQIGAQDLQNEKCQLAAKAATAGPHERYQAERALQQLETYVHQLIELARGVVLREQHNEQPEPPPDPSTLN